jgi:protein-S-isoprenylcysteine O-methyltransferase Ste14
MSFKSTVIEVIYRIATGSRRVRLVLTPIVGLSYLMLAVFCVLAGLAVDRWLGFGSLLPFPLNCLIGIPLMAAGLWMVLWSQLHFWRAKGTPVPINPPPRLVVSGPYVYVRNPMLGGIFVLLVGIGLTVGSTALSFIFTPLFLLINVAELKAIEEPELERRLGPDYLAYRRRTPMFFPSLRSFRAAKRSDSGSDVEIDT